jgi:hypothetical protein
MFSKRDYFGLEILDVDFLNTGVIEDFPAI